MINCDKIRCFAFSYSEAEDIMKQYNGDIEPVYEGGIVRGEDALDYIDFAEMLSKVRPELGISPTSISLYTEAGYIYARNGIDVLVIDGIS